MSYREPPARCCEGKPLSCEHGSYELVRKNADGSEDAISFTRGILAKMDVHWQEWKSR